jgi:hypothetical protein
MATVVVSVVVMVMVMEMEMEMEMVMVVVMVSVVERIGHVATGGIAALGIATTTAGCPGDGGGGYEDGPITEYENPCRANVRHGFLMRAVVNLSAATKAMHGMRKIVIAELEQAAAESSRELRR